MPAAFPGFYGCRRLNGFAVFGFQVVQGLCRGSNKTTVASRFISRLLNY